MRRLMTFMSSFALVAGLAGTAGIAQAQDCCDPTVCDTTYVPGHYETRIQRVEEPGRWVDEERVSETPGHYETRIEDVGSPGHWECVTRQVWVEGRWVGCGGSYIGFRARHVQIGFGVPASEWIPGHYTMVSERVFVPGCTEQRSVEVWVPGTRTVQIVRVWKPGVVREVPHQVWVPGRYVSRVVTRPTCRERTVIVPSCGGGITIGAEIRLGR